jgi:sec-independent protein translocase protein TatB
MEILGIGINELIFIIIIALIVLGPKDMQKAGKTIGRWLNKAMRSEWWQALQKTSIKIRELPKELAREANLEEINKEIRATASVASATSVPPKQNRQPQPYSAKPVAVTENKISPSTSEPKESESDPSNNA